MDGRFSSAARTAQAADEIEKLPLPRLGVEWWTRSLGIRNAEEIEYERQPLGQRLVEQYHPPSDLVSRRSRRIVLCDTEVAAKELEDGKERHGLPVRHPVPFVHWDIPRAAALGKLMAEAALPR